MKLKDAKLIVYMRKFIFAMNTARGKFKDQHS